MPCATWLGQPALGSPRSWCLGLSFKSRTLGKDLRASSFLGRWFQEACGGSAEVKRKGRELIKGVLTSEQVTAVGSWGLSPPGGRWEAANIRRNVFARLPATGPSSQAPDVVLGGRSVKQTLSRPPAPPRRVNCGRRLLPRPARCIAGCEPLSWQVGEHPVQKSGPQLHLCFTKLPALVPRPVML